MAEKGGVPLNPPLIYWCAKKGIQLAFFNIATLSPLKKELTLKTDFYIDNYENISLKLPDNSCMDIHNSCVLYDFD